ncbi:MAG: glycoside hydrolase family 27 protein [Sphingobacteriales bacterium]|nr:MAG: glycoside hydrolase family 27 protein [Sphingobacteriales bacterium]
MKKIILLLIVLCPALGLNAQQVFKQWAQQPPMGWNSYDAYYGCITEKQFKQEADVLSKRLMPYGYEYAVVDYCWFNPGPQGWDTENWKNFDVDWTYKKYGSQFKGMQLDAYGRLLPAFNRFPSAVNGVGFKALADYTHAKGMKFGIHVMRGIPRDAVKNNLPILGTRFFAKDIVSYTDTCKWNESMYGVDATKPGAAAYYESIINLYASWGVDFIKVDDIASPVFHTGEISLIRKAIDKCGRKIVLSLSPGDTPLGFATAADNLANMYRVSNDVWDRWKDILHIFDMMNNWSPFIGEGAWPDADMLPLGKLCLSGYPYAQGNPNSDKREHFSFLNYEEQKTLMSLWCIARSPLMWGGSAVHSGDSTFELLTNSELLQLQKNSRNNHQLYQPLQRSDFKNWRIWVANGDNANTYYVGLFNLQDTTAAISFNTEWEFWKGTFKATELWTKETLPVNGWLHVTGIPAHGVRIYKLQQQ